MDSLASLTLLLLVIGAAQAERITLKLIGGSGAHEGNVYVRRGSEWGLVCDDEWNIRAGNVVCRQLGYTKVKKVTTYNTFATANDDEVFLDDVKCGGFEKNLGECKHREWMMSDCHSGEAAGVICDVPTDEPPAELTSVLSEIVRPAATESPPEPTAATELPEPEAHDESEEEEEESAVEALLRVNRARLEEHMRSLREHGAHADAERHHALTPPAESTSVYAALSGQSGAFQLDQPDDSSPGNASEPIEERDVSQAEINKIDELIEELRVETGDVKSHKSAKPYRVEVVGGRNEREGYVRVHMDDGSSGAICSDNWGIFEAQVVCRAAGLEYADRATVTDFFGGSADDKVFYEVNCDGHEDSLADCDYKLTSRHGIKCSRPSNVAGVICTQALLPDLIPNLWALQTSMHLDTRSMSELTCSLEEGCLSSSAYGAQQTNVYNSQYVLPDIMPNITAIESTAQVQDVAMGYMTCAMEENCLSSSAYDIKERYPRHWSSSSRRLLRFSSNIYNNGTADFRPSQHRSTWEWHSCHMHYHSMGAFSHYDIVDSHGNRVAEGHKASFCLEDVECDPGRPKKYSCRGFGEQGISMGCADVYAYDIDCQWIDITDLKPGAYMFKLNVNPDYTVSELSFDNNAAVCELTYTGYSVKLNNCVLARG